MNYKESDLYKLPKDVLIKLICQIQEDCYNNLYQENTIIKCSVSKCRGFEQRLQRFRKNINIIKFNCDFVKSCFNCSSKYCDLHLKRGNNSILFCNKCYEEFYM